MNVASFHTPRQRKYSALPHDSQLLGRIPSVAPIHPAGSRKRPFMPAPQEGVWKISTMGRLAWRLTVNRVFQERLRARLSRVAAVARVKRGRVTSLAVLTK